MKANDIKQVFKEIIIDENQPGSILRDFEIFLRFIAENDLDATGKIELLPMKCLSDLNSRLTKPLDIILQRPQQKSYANINGLFLLARGSGLLLVQKVGKKKKLVINQEALKSWQSLNPTERYFTLVETLITRVSLEIIGEHESLFDHPLYRLSELLKHIPAKGLDTEKDKFFKDSGFSYFGAHNIAIGEMFGWLEIKHGKGEAGKGWIIQEIKGTDFGRTLIRLARESYQTLDYEWENALDEGEANAGVFNYLQPIFQPYFPQWQNVFRLPQSEKREGIFVFKVSLNSKLWRRIAISADDLLDDLHDVIQAAFDFDNDHLYDFSFRNQFGGKQRIAHPMCEDEEFFTDEFFIKDLPLKIGDKMRYLFDFGDSWRFDVELEEIQPPNPKFNTAKILAECGKSPEQYPDWEDE